MTSDVFLRLLIEGAIGGGLFVLIAFLLSLFVDEVVGRSLLVILLFTAAGAYFGFAITSGAGRLWLLIELSHIIVFGTMALWGWKGSPRWLIAGWALHPIWDIGLHYYGPGRPVAPTSYAIACVSFDVVVALYIAIVYGLFGRKLRFSR